MNTLESYGYGPYSIEEYKGIVYGQTVFIEGEEHTVYRIDDIANTITLVGKYGGIGNIDIDKMLEIMDK